MLFQEVAIFNEFFTLEIMMMQAKWRAFLNTA